MSEMKYGVEKGVLYPKNSPGVIWNGLISVQESENDSDVAVGYYDGEAYYRERTSEGFSAKVSAYTFPDVLYSDEPFGLSYVTGNELHIVYNAMPASFDRSSPTVKETPDPSIFTWNLVTTPVKIPGYKPSSHFIIDLDSTYPAVVSSLEFLLYGTDEIDPRLPPVDELLSIFEEGSVVRIIDNFDGTWTAVGPDVFVHMVDDKEFEIISPTAVYLDDHTYRISSW